MTIFRLRPSSTIPTSGAARRPKAKPRGAKNGPSRSAAALSAQPVTEDFVRFVPWFIRTATSPTNVKKNAMPFANFKLPEGALSKVQKEELIHKTTEMLVGYLTEAARPYTMVLIETVPDGGYGRADEVFVIPEAFRAMDTV